MLPRSHQVTALYWFDPAVKCAPPGFPPSIPASNTFGGLLCVTGVSFTDVTLCWCRWRRAHFTFHLSPGWRTWLGKAQVDCSRRCVRGAAAVTGPLNLSAALRFLQILWMNPAGGCIYRGRCQRRLQVDVTAPLPPGSVGSVVSPGPRFDQGPTNLTDTSKRCERWEDDEMVGNFQVSLFFFSYLSNRHGRS